MDSRVVWSEGMFLRTQHFQQQDRWIESLVRAAAVAGLTGYGWGFCTLKLDAGKLTTGKVAIAQATGILPDGTPFAIPDGADHPEPFLVGEATREGIVHLALPERMAGAPEVDAEGTPATGVRYRGEVREVRDAITGADGRAPIELARPRFSLRHESEGGGGFVAMGIARIKGRQADGSIVLDPDHIPPCLTIAAHPAFAAFLDELDGKLASVAASRVGYVLDPAGRGAAEVQDLLVLEIVNRARPVVAHLNTHRIRHPEALYRFLLGLCGEMATYGAADRQPPALPAYSHPEPGPAFRVLFDAVRRLLIELARPERKAAPVPLRLHRSGLRTTTEETTPQLFASATIVLAVSAAMPAERIRQQFPRLAMIGPAEDFNDIWTAKLRGIPVEPLPVAPRQIPFHAGMVYFELDRSDPYFRKLPRSTGLALAVEGEWPELAVECWAIRD